MSTVEWQLLVVCLVLVAMMFAVVLMIVPFPTRSKGSVIPGKFTVRERTYPYELGDLILRYDGAAIFSGIEVRLPKRFPHIFLDSLLSNLPATPHEFVFNDDNRISLEGDFDKHFRAYAPAAHKVLALSILSPDVLRVFIDKAYRFDVEIIEDRLRLITREKLVSHSEKLQEELCAAALAVLQEIDHRLQSWHEESLVGDTALDVKQVNSHFKQ